MDFLGDSDWNLSEDLVKQCNVLGFMKPTTIQGLCIPKLLDGENCICVSESGSGKTWAFTLAILQKLDNDPFGIFALVLTSTRRRASLLAEKFKFFRKTMNLDVCLVIGGMEMLKQSSEMSRQPHIVIATPGRLAAHLQSYKDFSFKGIKIVVFDEAHTLLGGQFKDQLQIIFDDLPLPSKRQTLMFFSNLSSNFDELRRICFFESFIKITEAGMSTVKKLDQHYVLVPLWERNSALVKILADFQEKNPGSSVIIFAKNRKWCEIISLALKNLGFQNGALNSLRRKDLLSVISKFKSNELNLLIAMGVACLGLDIPMVDLVINYSVPSVPKNYIHSVGRIQRVGQIGQAITIVTPNEIVDLKKIEADINTLLFELKISGIEKSTISEVEDVWKMAQISLEDQDADEIKNQIPEDGSSGNDAKRAKVV